MNIGKFNKIIPKICNKNTSSNPKDWSENNPTQGHCAVVSLLAQEIFGGDIVRVSLLGTPYKKMRSHYFNIINGKEHDFTSSQFKENPYFNLIRQNKTRDKILSLADTKRRYTLLKTRFMKY